MASGKIQTWGAEILWTVVNLSLWDIELMRRPIHSPLFRIEALGDCSWYLKMTPRGEIKGDHHLHVHLVLFAGELRGEINCEMAFITDEIIERGIVEKQAIGNFNSIKLSPCLLQDDVFLAKKALFLPKDTLSIRCRIWRTSKLVIETICLSTEILSHNMQFTWTIENFSFVLNSKVSYRSVFHIGKCNLTTMTWRLSVGDNSLDDGVVKFDLTLSTIQRLSIACELEVRNGRGQVVESVEIRKIVKQSTKPETLIFPKSMARRVLLEHLQNDVLTIYGKATVVTGDYDESVTLGNFEKESTPLFKQNT